MTFFLISYTQPIPVDVKVPAYAYQNVSVCNSKGIVKSIAKIFDSFQALSMWYSHEATGVPNLHAYPTLPLLAILAALLAILAAAVALPIRDGLVLWTLTNT